MAKRKANGNGAQSADELAVIDITSFEGLSRRKFDIEIETGGRVYRIAGCNELSYDDIFAIEREVPAPTPPVLEGPSGRIVKTDDPGYQQAVADVNQKRLMLKLMAMLPFNLPGDTRLQQIDALRSQVGYGFINGLTMAFNKTVWAQEARIDALADSFQSGRNGDEPDLSPNGVEPEPVAPSVAV